MMVIINPPSGDGEVKKSESSINDGLIKREPLGGYKHIPQYDSNNHWHDYTEIKRHDQPNTDKGYKRI